MPVKPARSELVGRIVDDADGQAALELIQRWEVETIKQMLGLVSPDGHPSPLTFNVCADALALSKYLKEKN
jgi:hypothetical protein